MLIEFDCDLNGIGMKLPDELIFGIESKEELLKSSVGRPVVEQDDQTESKPSSEVPLAKKSNVSMEEELQDKNRVTLF